MTDRRRLPYLLLLVVFAVSRVIYHASGVRFDTRPLATFFQFIDPELLRHRLLESLYYLHCQPPGFNFYAGIVLKLFPVSYGAAFHAVYVLLGAAICCLLYRLMLVCGVRSRIAFTLAALFIVTPGVVLYENFLLYEYLLVFLLLASASALHSFFMRSRVGYVVIFFWCLLFLVVLRNHFHLIYLLLALALLVYFARDNRRTVVLAAILPVLLASALFFKNWILFGSFASSTWMPMNMDVITSHQLTTEEARQLIDARIISPVSLIDAGSPISAYAAYATPPPPVGIPVLDEQITSTGATNFNNPVFLQIGQFYLHDGLAILRHYPRAYLRSVERAWFAYFLPAGDFPFFDLNRSRIYRLDRFFDVVLFGQWKDASDRKGLRAMESGGHRLALVLYTGTFLMAGLPLLWAGGIWYLIQGVRRGTLHRATIALLGFLLFNITYLTAVANCLSSFENNRYRFQVDAFFVVLLGIALELFLRPRES